MKPIKSILPLSIPQAMKSISMRRKLQKYKKPYMKGACSSTNPKLILRKISYKL
jgi:hypothetical protein